MPQDDAPRGPLDGRDPLADLDEAEALALDTERGPEVLERIQETRRQAIEWTSKQYLQIFQGVACSIAAELDLRALIKHILHTCVKTFGAERGVLFLDGPSGESLIPVLAVNLEGEELDKVERISRTILRHAHAGESISIADAMRDDRYKDVPSIRCKEIRSVLCAPLIAEGRPLGVIYLDALQTSGVFPTDGHRLLEPMAGIAAVALRNAQVHGEIRYASSLLRSQASTEANIEQLLVGMSSAIEDLRQKAALAAQLGSHVLIQCQPGSKPEWFAQAVALAGSETGEKFQHLDCAACPVELGAEIVLGRKDRPGLLLKAHRGVLFLEEISALDTRLQGKLARILTEKRFRPLGSQQPIPVELQLIASTSRGHIQHELRQERLHRRLHQHLNSFVVRIPPLSERREDIPLLVEHFAGKHAYLRSEPLRFSPESLSELQNLPLKGNEAELERLVRNISVRHSRSRIGVRALGRILSIFPDGTPEEPAATEVAPRVRSLAEVQRDAISEALQRANGNKSAAARMLRITRNTLLRKMKRFEL
jgi:DNA-binding NtrC family response regulator